MDFIMRFYNNGRLYDLFGSAPERHFATLLNAFSTKYGTPKMGTETWQNKAGATFDNTVATWQFRNGTLKLSQMGLQRDEMSFEFTDKANEPPPPPAVLNF